MTEIYRLNPDNAFRQGLWIVVGVAAFSATLLLLRHDYRRLESYKYLFGLTAIGLLVLPALPVIGQTVNGARLWVQVGGIRFQPGELAKIMLIIFLAGYLREKREVLAQGRIKDFGPLLAIWGAAMLVLVETNDLGSGLLYFGIFLAMLYVATARGWYALGGLVLFIAGAAVIYKAVPRVEQRVTVWLDPWPHAHDTGYQIVQSSYSIANGGFAGKGFGKGVFATTDGHTLIPFLPTDFIYSAHRPGARARRRRRDPPRLHGLLPARLPDRDAGAGRLLEAARSRPHVRLRAADVHHRRRRPADHPADRDHAPLHQLRRVERRRQLRSARGPPARLAPGELGEPDRDGGPHVNRQITRVAVVGLVLLASLIVGTTYWQAWAASGLADRQDNAIQRVAEFSVKRGKIIAADGRTVLADNYTRKAGNQKLYFRKYPQRGLAAHIVGYSTQVRSRAGLEASENDFLTGSNTNLSTVVDTTLNKLKGETIEGNDLHLTLRPGAQRIALNALGGKCGAAVALDVKTGRVLVSVSSPTYDPNLIENHYNLATRPKFGCSSLFNRAEAGLYIPGSAFKVVTASAALDSGKYTIDSTFFDPGFCTEYGKPVLNFADQSGPERFGRVTFTQAMQHSINAVFCNIGKTIGATAILNHAKNFGFYSVPPLETPVNERAISGLYNKGKLFFPKNDFQVDPGRLAFGQERMQVTPLQMAMVAAAIGERRGRHAAVRRRAGGRAGRLDGRAHEAGRARTRRHAAARRRGERDDAGRRQRRHRHRRPDSRDHGCRQDGHRGNG